jgi:hypothetical protein
MTTAYNYTLNPTGSFCAFDDQIPPPNATATWCGWTHLPNPNGNISTLAAEKCCGAKDVLIWNTGNVDGCVIDYCNFDPKLDSYSVGDCLVQNIRSREVDCADPPRSLGTRKSKLGTTALPWMVTMIGVWCEN